MQPDEADRIEKADRMDHAEGLLARAAAAAERAYAPYSGFRVGAALLAHSGRVFEGGNVENASFGLGVCAERVAVFKAVSAGEREFSALALAAAADRDRPGGGPVGAPVDGSVFPCGACLQVMAEFNPDLEIIVRDAGGKPLKQRLRSLLPQPFAFRPAGPGGT